MNAEASETLRGRRIGASLGRRPKLQEAGRVCTVADCSTILSRYNPRDRCRVHSLTRYPRLRGRSVAPS